MGWAARWRKLKRGAENDSIPARSVLAELGRRVTRLRAEADSSEAKLSASEDKAKDCSAHYESATK